MEITLTIDLEGAIARALTPDALAPILDKHIKSAITSGIQEATGYSSAFQKAVTEQVKQLLPHGLGIDDVAKFQQVLNQALRDAVHGANAAAVHTALTHAVQRILPDVGTTVQLSSLLEQARAHLILTGNEKRDAYFAAYKESDYGDGGWLYLDADANKDKYSAKYRLAFTKDGDVYSLHMAGQAITPVSRPDVISRFDGTLMAMYVGRTRLIVDMTPDEIETSAAEQYD